MAFRSPLRNSRLYAVRHGGDTVETRLLCLPEGGGREGERVPALRLYTRLGTAPRTAAEPRRNMVALSFSFPRLPRLLLMSNRHWIRDEARDIELR